MSDQWQPISTAPKDIDVLVYCSDTEEQFVAFDSLDEPGVFYYAHTKSGVYIGCTPTHWMPLPEAPK